jgi:transcriptional regulator with XRE-family HTH domain
MDQVTLEIMNPEEIGKRIKQARLAKGLKQHELGRLSGVSESAVSQWESGRIKQIMGPTLRKLASALKVSIDWLLEGEDAPARAEDDAPDSLAWEYLTSKQREDFNRQIREAAEHNRSLLEQFGVKKSNN